MERRNSKRSGKVQRGMRRRNSRAHPRERSKCAVGFCQRETNVQEYIALHSAKCNVNIHLCKSAKAHKKSFFQKKNVPLRQHPTTCSEGGDKALRMLQLYSGFASAFPSWTSFALQVHTYWSATTHDKRHHKLPRGNAVKNAAWRRCTSRVKCSKLHGNCAPLFHGALLRQKYKCHVFSPAPLT